MGAIGGMKDKIKDTLAPKHTYEESNYESGEGRGSRRVVVDVKVSDQTSGQSFDETPAGKTAATLKGSDQMSGQTFNDVGPLNEEGIRIAKRSS